MLHGFQIMDDLFTFLKVNAETLPQKGLLSTAVLQCAIGGSQRNKIMKDHPIFASAAACYDNAVDIIARVRRQRRTLGFRTPASLTLKALNKT